MSARGQAKADLVTSLVLIAVAAAAATLAWRMPRFENLYEGIYAAPGFLPFLLSLVLALLGTILLVRALGRGAPGRPAAGPAGEADPAGPRRLLLAAVLCLAYALGLVGRVWFPLATALFVFAFVALFEWGRAGAGRPRFRLVLAAAVEAVAVAAAVTAVFERLFLVRLP